MDSAGNAYAAGILLQGATWRMFVAKFSADGTYLWNWTATASGDAVSIALDADENVLLAGSTPGNGQAWVLRIDPTGSVIANQLGKGGLWNTVCVAPDGTCYLPGKCNAIAGFTGTWYATVGRLDGSLALTGLWSWADRDYAYNGAALVNGSLLYLFVSAGTPSIIQASFTPAVTPPYLWPIWAGGWFAPEEVAEPTAEASFIAYQTCVTLNWTPSPEADGYRLYRYSKAITAINASVSLVGSLSGVLSSAEPQTTFCSTGDTLGDFYFTVVAVNATGGVSAPSNSQRVSVIIPGHTIVVTSAGIGGAGIAVLFGISFLHRKRMKALKL